MKIKLFRAFPDRFRESMLLYSDVLEKRLRQELAQEDQVTVVKPCPAFLGPAPVRYFSQYLCYQVQAGLSQGDINHITDHAYGHLVHTLDPRRTIVTFHDAIRFKHVIGDKKQYAGFHPVKSVMNYNLRGITKAAFIICDSESSRRDLIDLTGYAEEKTAVIALGVDEHFFNQRANCDREALNIAPGLYLLHVGHTGGYKNIPALFRVLYLLRKKGKKNIRLLKAGMKFSPEQEQLAHHLQIEDQIVHVGRLDSEKLGQIYRTANVLLFPSLDEGFGFPVLEAMASKLPVVASNRGSLPDILGDHGILVEPDDYEAMARGVLKFLEDDHFRMEKTEAAVRRAREFTWKKTAEQTLDIYRRVYEDLKKR